MSAFNTRPSKAHVPHTDPIQSTGTILAGPKGAVAYRRTPQSELALLATTGFFGQGKFYESAAAADSRFVALVREVTQLDWAWVLDFTSWLRHDANIRSAAAVAGLEAAKMMVELHGEERTLRGSVGAQGAARQLAKAGISRLDEVGEATAYWVLKYGRNIPKPIKRALADRLGEMTEYTAVKYNSDNSAYKLEDLIRLLHPKPTSPDQSDLFAWVIAQSEGPTAAPDSLPMIQARQLLMGLKVEARRLVLDPVTLTSAGLTWEAMAGWLQGPLDARAWEAIIPNMNYMALLRNLRNFDEVGISRAARDRVCEKLSSPVEVAKSRQLPMRFLSAMRAVASYHWHSALSAALDASLLMVPTLPGRTLVLVDTSGSMEANMSEHGTLARWDVAAMFGIALATTSPGVELHSYSSVLDQGWARGYRLETKQFIPARGADTASQLMRWANDGYNICGGTPSAKALAKLFNGHDRVILITDEAPDAGEDVTGAIPADVHLFTFNVAGYKAAGTPTTRFRHTFGGLNDQAFKLVKLTEDCVAGQWPWMDAEEVHV